LSEKSNRLTIYLAKDRSIADEEIIKDIEALTSIQIELNDAVSANVYIRKAQPHPP
jgi:hypothetical protein